jgi:hypothetical protein
MTWTGFGEDTERKGTCVRCEAECWVINGVATHADGWRDDECRPSAAEVCSHDKAAPTTSGHVVCLECGETIESETLRG